MQHLPVQITFRQMEPSAALEQKIRKRAAELLQFFEGVLRCDVAVEQEHQRHQQGNIFRVRIHITVPGDEIVVSRETGKNHAHEDAYVTVRDAFDIARRQLEDHARRRAQRTKQHATPHHGRVSELVPMQDYGRIETVDGREIYFHRNSLIDGDFDELDIGTEVRFTEEAGDNGPQASSLQRVGKHHIIG